MRSRRLPTSERMRMQEVAFSCSAPKASGNLGLACWSLLNSPPHLLRSPTVARQRDDDFQFIGGEAEDPFLIGALLIREMDNALLMQVEAHVDLVHGPSPKLSDATRNRSSIFFGRALQAVVCHEFGAIRTDNYVSAEASSIERNEASRAGP